MAWSEDGDPNVTLRENSPSRLAKSHFGQKAFQTRLCNDLELFQFTHPSLEEQVLYLVLRSAVLGHPAPVPAEKLTSADREGEGDKRPHRRISLPLFANGLLDQSLGLEQPKVGK